jgi:ubiquitin-conjugating enzyme E2 W
MRLATKRLAKELTELRASGAPAGCALLQADDLQTWLFSISVLGESVYAGETFALRFRFPDAYPMESPECVFVTDGGWKAPVVSG